MTVALMLLSGKGVTNAQSSKAYSLSKKDTVSIFNNRLKITLNEGTFETLPAQVCSLKYAGLFNLHDVTNSSGFVLRAKDTLAFYMTSIDRPVEKDGGVATWEIINSFLYKVPAYRMESGWNMLGRDYLYFVKLVIDTKHDYLFEFKFFFIDNKLVLSLLQRPIIKLDSVDQENFTLLSPK